MEDLRKVIGRCKNRGEQEDRISQLPDELIHRILSFADVDLAVRTSVLSKRWINLWSTLPHLNFGGFPRNGDQYCKFVKFILSKRNQKSGISTIRINCRRNESITKMIVDYAIRHSVQHFYVSDADFNGKLSFLVLETLHLSTCRLSLMDWSLPCLRSLHLDLTINYTPFSFEGFNKLEYLSLSSCYDFRSTDVFVIHCPNVTRLNIREDFCFGAPASKYVITAPKLSCFGLGTWGVPVLSAKDGFTCVKEVKFDITLDEKSWKEYKEKRAQEVEKLISMFREFCGIRFLTLNFRTIQVLSSRSLNHIRCKPSPFAKLESLKLRDYDGWGSTSPTNSTNIVINYLLNSSACAEVFVEEHKDSERRFRSYNPKEDMLFGWKHGLSVVKIRENIPFKKPATIDVQVNGEVISRGLGVIPAATVVKGHTCTYSKDDSLSLWEGHRVHSDYVYLLTYIKREHPETFEHFTPQTDIINTLGLNTLCSLVRAVSEVSKSSLTQSTITRFKGLFADMERWGFNTTWLLNLLNNADEF